MSGTTCGWGSSSSHRCFPVARAAESRRARGVRSAAAGTLTLTRAGGSGRRGRAFSRSYAAAGPAGGVEGGRRAAGPHRRDRCAFGMRVFSCIMGGVFGRFRIPLHEASEAELRDVCGVSVWAQGARFILHPAGCRCPFRSPRGRRGGRSRRRRGRPAARAATGAGIPSARIRHTRSINNDINSILRCISAPPTHHDARTRRPEPPARGCTRT